MDFSPELVNRIRNGDVNAYETFVKQTWTKAVRACWMILGEQRDAEQAAQDAYVQLFEKRDQLRDNDKFSSWFYRILMNSAKQLITTVPERKEYWRRAKRRAK
jgi:RNA polymerase sigma-70 factor, ECF subfamily